MSSAPHRHAARASRRPSDAPSGIRAGSGWRVRGGAFGWGWGLLVLAGVLAGGCVRRGEPAAGPSDRVGSGDAMAGAGRIPPGLWDRDFTREIDGPLPADLTAVLQDVADRFIARAPAVSVAIAIPGVGRWDVSQGVARTGAGVALPSDARFQVASITKTFTAAAILQLEAEGRLGTSQSIDRWFPGVPNAGTTTVEHLLRHASGLVSFNSLPAWTTDYRTPRDAIAMATAVPPAFAPGAGFAYSNTGYAMLGVIVEELESRTLGTVFQERFAGPLRLAHTVLRSPEDDLPVVSGHDGGKPVDVPDHYATPFAAGGLASTAADLVTFWHALLGGRVVPPTVVRSLFADPAPMDPDGRMFYGRGVQLYDIPDGPGLMLGHSGGIVGFSSIVAYLAADDLYVSVVFNDQKVPAEAGLWAVARAVRTVRGTGSRELPGRKDDRLALPNVRAGASTRPDPQHGPGLSPTRNTAR